MAPREQAHDVRANEAASEGGAADMKELYVRRGCGSDMEEQGKVAPTSTFTFQDKGMPSLPTPASLQARTGNNTLEDAMVDALSGFSFESGVTVSDVNEEAHHGCATQVPSYDGSMWSRYSAPARVSSQDPGRCVDSGPKDAELNDATEGVLKRSVQVEAVDAPLPVSHVIALCQGIGAVHANKLHSEVSLTVTFLDSRDCDRAVELLSQVPGVAQAFALTSPELEHELTDTVLALKRVSGGGPLEGIGVDQIKPVLRVFGDIASSCTVTLPDNSAGLVAQVFKFHNAAAAVHAVDAIGDRPGSTFSLHLIKRNGALASLDGSDDVLTLVPADGDADEQAAPMCVRLARSTLRPAAVQLAPTLSHLSAYPPQPNARPCYALPPPDLAPSHGHMAAGPYDFGSAWASAPPPAGLGYLPRPPPLAAPAPSRMHMDYLTDFDVHEAAAGGPRARTTVMIRNIPCRWNAEEFLSVLGPIIGNTWDLLYMPCKNSEVVNSGYAFMNFATSQDTLRLFQAIHGHHWPNTRSGKICEIRYARIQGRQLLSHLTARDRHDGNAFRGHFAFPSAGHIVIHGPESMRYRTRPDELERRHQAGAMFVTMPPDGGDAPPAMMARYPSAPVPDMNAQGGYLAGPDGALPPGCPPMVSQASRALSGGPAGRAPLPQGMSPGIHVPFVSQGQQSQGQQSQGSGMLASSYDAPAPLPFDVSNVAGRLSKSQPPAQPQPGTFNAHQMFGGSEDDPFEMQAILLALRQSLQP